jgi:hypothetical protein
MSDINLIGDSLIEPFAVPDKYADGLGDVELCGGGHNVRLTYYTAVRGENIIVAKVVIPVAVADEHVLKLLAEKQRVSPSKTLTLQ